MRSSSRCQGARRGAVFSRKYSRFSCGRPSSARRRSALSVATLLTGPVGTVRHRSLNTLSSCWRRSCGPLLLDAQIGLLLAGIAVDAMRHQRVRGIERLLDRQPAVALLALRDVGLGEFEIVENAVGIGPLLEQIVVLEEMVVAEGGVRDHQRLHGRGVLLHQIGDARRRVDDDLIGEAHQALAVGRLLIGEVLAERPMLVEQRHADRANRRPASARP